MIEQDKILIERIRPIMKRRKGYSEKKMFGSLCFFIHGNMCVGPWKGSLIVRMAKEDHEETQLLPHAKPMDITGKVMKGWAKITPGGIKADEDLKVWIDRAIRFVRTLPAK